MLEGGLSQTDMHGVSGCEATLTEKGGGWGEILLV